MKKLSLCALLFALCVSVGFGQQIINDDRHKIEVFGGYSNSQFNVGTSNNASISSYNAFNDRKGNYNGFNASVVGNFSHYVGIKGDVSGHYKNFGRGEADFDTLGYRIVADASLYNFLGGVQVKDNRKEGSRFRPFGHALAGVARSEFKINQLNCFTVCPRFALEPAKYGFAAAIGGGLDIKANNRLSIRAVQADYNPTRLRASRLHNLDNTTQHNFRFGFGVVFH